MLQESKWEARRQTSISTNQARACADDSCILLPEKLSHGNARKSKAKEPRQEGWAPQPLGRPKICLHYGIYQETACKGCSLLTNMHRFLPSDLC